MEVHEVYIIHITPAIDLLDLPGHSLGLRFPRPLACVAWDSDY